MTHTFKEKLEFVLNAQGMMDTIIDKLMDLQASPSWDNMNTLIESIEIYQQQSVDQEESDQDWLVQRQSEEALLNQLIGNLSEDY